MTSDKIATQNLVWDEITLGIRDDNDGEPPVIRLYACPYGDNSNCYKNETFYPYAVLYAKHSVDDDYDLDWFYETFLDDGELVFATPDRIVQTAKALKGIANISGCEFQIFPETLERYGVLISVNESKYVLMG